MDNMDLKAATAASEIPQQLDINRRVFNILLPEAQMLHVKLRKLQEVGVNFDELYQPIDAISCAVFELMGFPLPEGDIVWEELYGIFDRYLCGKLSLDDCYQEIQAQLPRFNGKSSHRPTH